MPAEEDPDHRPERDELLDRSSVRRARLLGREDLSGSLALFRLAPDGGVPAFEAGQFLPLGLEIEPGQVLWRPYSIASPPEEERHLELYVRRVDEPPDRPHLTRALWQRRPGDELLWRSPRGRFTVPAHHPDGSVDARRLLLVGAGTGLAPFLSIVRHLHRRGSPRPILLCHGASHVAELGHADLLRDLERQSLVDPGGHWDFRYLPTISRPHEPANRGWSGSTGRVEELLRRGPGGGPSAVERLLLAPLRPGTTRVQVCGGSGTIRGVLAALAPLGFRDQRRPRPDGSFDVASESYG